jgi:hypothetical protein
VWVTVSVDAAGTVALERTAPDGIETVHVDGSCRSTAHREPRAPATGFTDAALAERLARGGPGVILLWSPHMPLSVDQHSVLKAVAEERGMTVIPVLDPSSDRRYAETVARDRRLDAGALEPLASIELAFRGMTTHAPSLQLFKDGRLVGPVLFGFRSEAAARLAIAAALDGR